MKKLTLAMMLLIASPLSYALEAKGTIEEIQICGAGSRSGAHLVRTLQFKVDGKWFGTYADYSGYSVDYDHNISTSLVMMAYAQNLIVHINATDSWTSSFNNCGASGGATFNDTKGDFIRISK